MSHDISIISTTLPGEWKEFEVGSFSHRLVEHGVACVQLIPINSMYKWKGEVNSEKEWKLELKVSNLNLDSVIKFLKEIHPYDNPQIIYWNAKGTSEYSKWVDDHS
ncbi:MAG: divalent-cation tolerance protein CutA [Candidatus Poseidoniaceae archaeon]|nr:divalent-cation tolerance protein CutA [Candidatus Poseidoniaceae archaeon]